MNNNNQHSISVCVVVCTVFWNFLIHYVGTLSRKAGKCRFIAYNILANQFIDIIYNKMKRPR